jgi:hypothetical protein
VATLSNVAALVYKDSAARLRARIFDAADAQIISGVTVLGTLRDAAGTAIFTDRSMTYSGTEKLHRADDSLGCWACDVAAAELDEEARYTATIVMMSGATVLHTVVLGVTVTVDGGR